MGHSGVAGGCALKFLAVPADFSDMRITTRGERNASVTPIDPTALDRIRVWTDAAEMDADEDSVRLLTESARAAAGLPPRGA